jgi:two-component system, cell cycle sensor histidine kinase and response regulator CckA
VKKRILLVENDTVLAVLTKLELQDLGYDVLQIAATAEKAIELAIENHPNLILMDIKLDGALDGTEAATQIRKHLPISVIFLTGTTDSDIVRKCLSVPVEPSEALQLLAEFNAGDSHPSEPFAA